MTTPLMVPAWHPLASTLIWKLAEFEISPRAAFYTVGRRAAFKAPDDDWAEIVRVVLDTDGEVIGMMTATIDRDARAVTNMSAACFVEHHPAFAVALRRFVLNMVAEFEVVRFSAVVGGPNVEMYRRAVLRLGGNVAGVFSRYARDANGRLIDFVWYEILGNGGRS